MRIFLNRLHFKRFLLRLTGNCFPQAGPIATCCHSAEGPWPQRASSSHGPPAGGGPHAAGPGPAGGHKGSPMPRLQWERTKEFQGNLYSRVRSQLQARSRCLAVLRHSRIPVHTLHAQCSKASGAVDPVPRSSFRAH